MYQKDKNIRLQSLDIFRGIIVCMMIVVGSSGNYSFTYRMLDHAPWSGFTPTDFIFPSFVFIVGVAQSLSVKKASNSGESFLLKILKRAGILFLLGLLINWFPFCFFDESGQMHLISISDVRIFGVLQRIAIAYGISSLIEFYFSEKRIVIISILILVVYVSLYYMGFSTDPYGISTSIAAGVDRFFIGINHMYREQGIPFDPEGLFSTIPVVVNILGGYLTGRLIQQHPFELDNLVKGMVMGCILFVIGYLWSYQDPINKKLWTSSYTLITIGMDIMFFVCIVYWVDVNKEGFPLGSFFISFGKNPILIYLFSELLMKLLLFPMHSSGETIYANFYNRVFSLAGKYRGSLLQAISYLLLCWSLVWYLDRRKFYLKI